MTTISPNLSDTAELASAAFVEAVAADVEASDAFVEAVAAEVDASDALVVAVDADVEADDADDAAASLWVSAVSL